MLPERPRVLYFVPDCQASTSGALHSQVLSPARYLAENGVEGLFVGADTSEETAQQAGRQISERYGIPAHVWPGFSVRHGFLTGYRVCERVRQLAREVIGAFRPTHVYAWTFVAGRSGRKIAGEEGAVYVYDIKGIRCEEIALWAGYGPRYHVCRLIELREMRRADRLGCVSERLQKWVKQQLDRDDTVVIPCCIDPGRFTYDAQARREMRKELGLSEEARLICYNGGLEHWQRIGDILRLFREVAVLRPDWRFLFLTLSGEKLNALARQARMPLERCIVRGCPHHRVPHYLSAADVGVIMRHNNVVNNTASPIKIGEYLGCGLPIIMTHGIGDFGEKIHATGIGLMLNENGDTARQVVDFLSALGDVKQKAMEFGHRHLVFSAYLDSYRRLFAV